MTSELSIATDFASSTGDVTEPLRLIHEAGFRRIHWCHHWTGDYLYSYAEVVRIGRLLRQFDLELVDLHASAGTEKYWCSTEETARLAGEELLLNRIRMTHDLGGRVIVLHPSTGNLTDATDRMIEQGIRTLSTLESQCRFLGVRIGLENMAHDDGNAAVHAIGRYFARFSPDYLGFCWDTGHSNIISRGIERVSTFTDRLLALHLHDNHGISDEHLPIGKGTVDWNVVAGVIGASPYDGPLTQEVSMPKDGSPETFLSAAHETGMRFLTTVLQATPGLNDPGEDRTSPP